MYIYGEDFIVGLSEAAGPSGYIGGRYNSRTNTELNKWASVLLLICLLTISEWNFFQAMI